MQWRGRRGSANIEDRRGRRMSGGGGRRVAVGGVGGLGAVAIVVVGWFLGVDLTPMLTDGGTPPQTTERPLSEADREAGTFVSVVLADTEEVWSGVFRNQLDATYPPPTLVLFSGVTQSACGGAQAATGPFFCPGDDRVYLDTTFFTTLERQLGAGGDFVGAYVVAHEVGHYVQDLLGTLGEANALGSRLPEAEANAVSVRVELQADCYAGIWAHHAEARLGTLEPGDIAEAMNAAAQIGDDALQARNGVVRPHTFTHGTSEQRQRWFETGYRAGEVTACDTFDAAAL